MRQVMTGIGFETAIRDALILAVIGVASFALTALVAHRRLPSVRNLIPVLKLG